MNLQGEYTPFVRIGNRRGQIPEARPVRKYFRQTGRFSKKQGGAYCLDKPDAIESARPAGKLTALRA
ncbi:hypothetical protein [Burkholderia anthina]|uniref:hypothetical protein n=1 Tax=Burkholderia anthina TaxID=179879 RepID=UPI00158DFC8D|nr:hypothetical protein [Burkholderia anthina]